MYEVLPAFGQPGCRACVLGTGFVESAQLRVRFGDFEVQPQFHESGCLVVPQIPRLAAPASAAAAALAAEYQTNVVPVQVSNDGVNYCDTQVYFRYL